MPKYELEGPKGPRVIPHEGIDAPFNPGDIPGPEREIQRVLTIRRRKKELATHTRDVDQEVVKNPKQRIADWYARLREAGENDELAERNIKESFVTRRPSDKSRLGREKLIDVDNLHFFLDTLGLDPDRTISAWESAYSAEEWEKDKGMYKLFVVYRENINALFDIEIQRPGSSQVLTHEFGIRDFSRYTDSFGGTQHLIDQYDQRGDRSHPYGIVFTPREDHNNVFRDIHKIITSIKNGLGESFLLRAYEIDNSRALFAALIRANRLYGPRDGNGHKVSFTILGGHGDEGTIKWGKKVSEGYTATGDRFFSDPDLQAIIAGFYVDDPTYIFGSCATGVDGGIAHQIAHISNGMSIAPEEDTPLPEITATIVNNKPVFTVTYPDTATKIYTSQQPITTRVEAYTDEPSLHADMEI